MPLDREVGRGPGHTVLDGDPAAASSPTPPKKGGTADHGWMDQDATWHEGRPRPWPHCVTWDILPPKGHTLNFRPMSVVVKRLDGSRIKMSLGREAAASAQATLC